MIPSAITVFRSTARRAGFTLVELAVTVAIAGMVATIAIRTFRTQFHSIAGSVELAEMRGQLRQGVHLLATELRPIAPDEGDIHDWAASRVVIRSVTGSSILCGRTSDSTLALPPVGAEGGNALTTWLAAPQPGDSMLVLDDGLDLGSRDDRWRAFEITSVAKGSAPEECRWTTGSSEAAGDDAPHFRVAVSGPSPLPRTVMVGAPVRIVQLVRYELYRSGEGAWYLGSSECRARRTPPCSTIQPVSGPYLPATSDGNGSGLELAYFDVRGTRLAPSVDDVQRLSRVDVVVRAETSGSSAAGRGGAFVDSSRVSVAIRNRYRP
jgi:prepilin-type N-terminal cleavage/methylation domain-containing protein